MRTVITAEGGLLAAVFVNSDLAVTIVRVQSVKDGHFCGQVNALVHTGKRRRVSNGYVV